MGDVFISFIHEERAIATAVQKLLREQLDLKSFMASDPWQIYAGEDWLARILKELKAATVVVSMLSAESIKRPWINFEAGGAWMLGKHLLPVCFGGLAIEGLPKPYSNIQALALPDDAYYLVTSVAHHLEKLPPPPFLSEGDEINGIRAALGMK